MRRRPSPLGRTPLRAAVASRALAILASALASVALAQPGPRLAAPGKAAESRPVLDSLGRRGDLTLRDATLESALFTVSELWGVNIVAGKVEGSVNGVFKDAPLRDILDTILLSNGYAYRPVGGSLVVSRLEELGQINPFFVTETIPVGVAEVGEVVEAARLMSTPQGQVRALPSAGAILVVDFPDRVAMIRDLARQLDTATQGLGLPGVGPGPRPLEVAYFRTHFISATTAATALDAVLSEAGQAAPIDKDDRLLIVDYAENIRMAEAVLARLDRPRPQVNIKALIYDISLSDMERIGVNWNSISNGSIDATGVATQQNTGLRALTQTAAPLGASDSGGAFTFYALEGNFNLNAVVVALQQAEDSRLLADPNVTVMDNEPAKIESISEIPFQQLTQTTGGGNIGTTAFKEVGIKLDVTPKIARDATIDMAVVPEFSRLAGFTPGDNQPIVETRRATTRVRVADRQTIMIAGLRQRTDVGDFNGIPLLKDVRFLGHLFRSRDTRIEESELVVFITPEIIGYADGLDERDRLSADTIHCRLDRIPAAEGCPSCDGTSPCDGGPPEVFGTLAEPPSAPLSPEPAAETPVDQAEQPVEVVEPEVTDAESLRYPRLSSRTARRLPSVSEASPPRLPPSAERSAPEGGQNAHPLRVDYDSRFRAPGGINRPTAGAPAPEEAATSLGGGAEGDRPSWQFWR